MLSRQWLSLVLSAESDGVKHCCEHAGVLLLALLSQLAPLIKDVMLHGLHLVLKELSVAVVHARPLRLAQNDLVRPELSHLDQLEGEQVEGLLTNAGEEGVRLEHADEHLALAVLVLSPHIL